MADIVEAVDTFDLNSRMRVEFGLVEAGFGYRRSAFPPSAVITGATLMLEPDDDGRIRERMEHARAWRRATQPLAEANCGSVFKNPPGDHAARLVDAAGLKGTRVGGASVSIKHANFIVADPGARASDVRALIALVTDRVRESSGVELETEVRFVGPFDEPT
jgi:UDP-N-acetylmuramate dehydrogenase